MRKKGFSGHFWFRVYRVQLSMIMQEWNIDGDVDLTTLSPAPIYLPKVLVSKHQS